MYGTYIDRSASVGFCRDGSMEELAPSRPARKRIGMVEASSGRCATKLCPVSVVASESHSYFCVTLHEILS